MRAQVQNQVRKWKSKNSRECLLTGLLMSSGMNEKEDSTVQNSSCTMQKNKPVEVLKAVGD